MASSAPSLLEARVSLIAAAVFWSSGSFFIRILKEPTAFGLSEPGLSSLQVVVYRALFASLIMLPLIRKRDVQFRPAMFGMVLAFTSMSGLYLTALDQGAAANAIFLQNTAPFWVYVIGVYFLGERADARATVAILIGLAGAGVIVAGGWPTNLPVERQAKEIGILTMAIGSGVFYAGVILFLRSMRDCNPAWLVFLNHLGSSFTLAAAMMISLGLADWWHWITVPTARQLAFLAVFGTLQMALPYWLFSRGLRTVGSQEAALITLLEPLLNPVWAFLITPEKDAPTWPMVSGGSLILAALLWRYVPQRRGKSRPAISDSPLHSNAEGI